MLYEVARSAGERTTLELEESCWYLGLLHAIGRVIWHLERTPKGVVDGGAPVTVQERNGGTMETMTPAATVQAVSEMDLDEAALVVPAS